MATPRIVVIGSCNIDITIYVSCLPLPGETIDAHKLIIRHGGKGANQCVAAARLGASTAMVGRAEKITGLECVTVSQAEKSIKILLKKGCSTVIITLGVNGVVFATANNPKPKHVAVENVNAVDTTGAGDSFIGALAFYLAYFPALPFQKIISRCCCIATETVMKQGAQKSFPYQNQLSDSLFHLQSEN